MQAPLGQVGVLVAGDDGDGDLGSGVDDQLEAPRLGEGQVGADDDDLRGPQIGRVTGLACVLGGVVAEFGESLLVTGELGLEAF